MVVSQIAFQTRKARDIELFPRILIFQHAAVVLIHTADFRSILIGDGLRIPVLQHFLAHLSNHELYTVGRLGQYIAETQRIFSKIKAESAAKERRIRDIDALFGTIQTIRELKPIQQEYESIHWSSKREKYKAEHGNEKYKAEHGDELSRLQKAIWLREKLMKSLGLASPLDKEQRAALKAERARLEAEREALLPKLEEVKGELAERNRIRYWTRKVVPDALPRVSDGRVSVEDAMETAVNRKELEQVKDEAARMAAHQPQEQEKQEPSHRRLRPAAANFSEGAPPGIV